MTAPDALPAPATIVSPTTRKVNMFRRFAGLFLVMLSAMGVQSAHASEYKVETVYRATTLQEFGTWVTYVNLVMSMPLCHELTPLDVDAGDLPLTEGNYVSGTIDSGCLVSQVTVRALITPPLPGAQTQAIETHWSQLPGVPGGNWNFRPQDLSDSSSPYVLVKQ